MLEATDDKIEIRQGIDPDYFSNILTKDVTTLESIFELVDNAVDAARDRLLRRTNVKRDSYGLPADYSGYTIDLNFWGDVIEFTDNCAGIPENVLRMRAFVVGAMSSHPFGIGRFGIGLKRALVGLGTKYLIETDTGKFAARLEFGISAMRDLSAPLTARRRTSGGKPRMFIRISKLREKVAGEFEQPNWSDYISTQLSRRYGIFIDKGFEIRVDGQPISRFGPKLRKIKGVEPQSDSVRLVDGVHVYIDSGMHQDYRLKNESDYNKKSNSSLTDQFGWYFVCNDRIVEVATHEKNLGWTSRWHQEYYGFVGWVRFVAHDPQNLPWDTKKSRIDPYTAVFLAISGRLQSFAEYYKKRNKKERVTPQEPEADEGSSHPPAGKPRPKPSPPDGHNENWTNLLPPMGIAIKNRKLAALVYEAERLNLTHCYAGSMLLRAIVEMALLTHLRSRRKISQVLEDTRKKAKEVDADVGSPANSMDRVSLSEALRWLGNNEAYFPDEVRRECVFSRRKFATHLKEMNGIVHDGDLTNSEKLRSVRDDVMPLLEFLLAD